MRLPRRTLLLLAGAAALATLAGAGLWQSDVVLYNATPSLPVGFYLRTSGPIERGAIVTVRARDAAPRHAAERNFTDRGDRFLKRVAGAVGDEVCAADAAVTLNGARVAQRQARDSAGRPLPSWEGCVTLDEAHVFLLGDSPDSFDGRYWGPTPVERIEGVWRRFGVTAPKGSQTDHGRRDRKGLTGGLRLRECSRHVRYSPAHPGGGVSAVGRALSGEVETGSPPGKRAI